MTITVEQIDQWLTELDRDQDRLTEQRRLLGDLRATLTDEPAPEVDVAPARPAKRPAKKRPARDEQQVCPDCGQVCASPQGLAAHRRHNHPRSAAKPVVPAPSRDPQVAGKVLRCSCGHEEPNVRCLTVHTTSEHGRTPAAVERMPVDPKVAA